MNYLNSEQIKEVCPSAFTQGQSTHLSKVYNHIPTTTVIDILEEHNWKPVQALQGRSRRDSTHLRPFKKHILRFRNPEFDSLSEQINDTFPEVIVTNSHDGKSSFRFHIGLFRLVCSNGMVIADKSFGKYTILHKGLKSFDIVDTIGDITRNIPHVVGRVQDMMSHQLELSQRKQFGMDAVEKRWGDGREVDIDQLLSINRNADSSNDLWTVYNRVQEKLIGGGLNTSIKHGDKVIHNKTRKVNSIDENIRINKMLWELAESYLN